MSQETEQQINNVGPVEHSRTAFSVLRAKLGRIAATGALLLGSTAITELADTQHASATNTIIYNHLGYSYWDEPCEHSPYTTSGGENYCLNYDWGPTPDTTPGWTESDSYDPNYGGYGYRNCTDFVAWRIDTNGGHVPNNLGSGGNWLNSAPSSDDSSTPEAGYAAVSPANNHVAYVESVNSVDPDDPSQDNITVEEYNYDLAGDGDIQTGTPASMGFTGYLDFGGVPGNFQEAFQTNDGDLYTYTPNISTPTTLGLMADTSPAIAELSGGGYEEAFQSNDGQLWVNGDDGSYNTEQGMMADTSPAIVGLPGGSFEVAFQNNDGDLYYYTPDVATNTGLGMMTDTSPSITAFSNGSFEVAFQANTGDMWYYTPNNGSDSGDGMMAGTSPSITTLSNGSFEVAFQANDGYLFNWATDGGGVNSYDGMLSGTNPSITALSDGSFEDAFQANNGELYYYNFDGGGVPAGNGMMTGTSPSITTLSDGNFEIGFQANNGDLYYYAVDGGGVDTQQGMASGTSPSIAGN